MSSPTSWHERPTGRRRSLALAAAATAPFVLAFVVAADVPLSKRDADRLQNKLDRVLQNGVAERPAALKTRITEAEVNSYLRFALVGGLPPGISEPYVTIEGDGRLSGRAVVDLERVKAARAPASRLDPLSFVGGKVPITAAGVVRTREGVARVELQSAAISGVPVPVMLLQVLVTQYSRSPDNPDGIHLDGPIPLPAGIKEIRVGKGEAIVIQ